MPDIGPHQKYFYALDVAREVNLPMVTGDDDCVYSSWWLQRLYTACQELPGCIVGYRARLFSFNNDNSVLPYHDWPYCDFADPDPIVFFTGVSGVFYPYEFSLILAGSGDAFKKTCPRADDIWLNYVASRSGYPARQVFKSPWGFPEVPMTQDQALWTHNQAGGNDVQIAATYDKHTLSMLREAHRCRMSTMSPQHCER